MTAGIAERIAALEQRAGRFVLEPQSDRLEDILPALHELHDAANEPYRNFCRSLGIGPRVDSWRTIPFVPQAAFKQTDMRSFPAAETVKTFHTSGTTGERFGRHHFRTLRLYELAVREGWRHAGAPEGPFLVLAPHPDEAPHSSLSHMLAALAPRGAFAAWGGVFDIDRLAALDRPHGLLGTALGFLRLFEAMDRRGLRLRLPRGTTAVETGGYKGSGRELTRDELYARFGEFLGIVPEDIFNEYGMTELSSQFYARGAGGRHTAPPWARAVIVDPATGAEVDDGETGLVCIYDAMNVGSVCGLRTQDLAVRRGDAFELLGRDPAALPRGCSRAADEWFGAERRTA